MLDYKKVINRLKDLFHAKKDHMQLSLKVISAVFMISTGLLGAVFMMDASLFSASLIQDKIYTEDSEILETSETFAGLLPNSPLYNLSQYFAIDQNSAERSLLLFAKTAKASLLSEELAESVYEEFLESLAFLSQDDQEIVLEGVIAKGESVDIEADFFAQVFDVYSMKDEESVLIQKIAQAELSSELLRKRGEMVFSSLVEKNNWKELIQKNKLQENLVALKQKIESPIIKDGETFHAAAENWMKDNELWKSL